MSVSAYYRNNVEKGPTEANADNEDYVNSVENSNNFVCSCNCDTNCVYDSSCNCICHPLPYSYQYEEEGTSFYTYVSPVSQDTVLCRCEESDSFISICNSHSEEFCLYCGQKYEDCNSSCNSVGESTRCVSAEELDNEQENCNKISDDAEDALGGAYMNGEIGSSVRPVSGETGMPTMVYPQPVTSLAPPGGGPHFHDSHGINGVIMSQELYGDQMGMDNNADGIDKQGFDASGQPIQAGHTPDLPIDDLKRLLLSQLEYYFSPENLAQDKFLVSQMDQDHYVPITTLASFNMVKKLTSNIDLVTEVLRESKNCQVHADGKRVRPISHRTVVILRGIPASTSEVDIKNLFENENCPKCTGCEFAFNDSWYISFETDEDAQRAHRYLREDVREFKGQPIMARIKSKPTTLLAQGIQIGMPMKNGFTQQGAMMQSYMTAASPFVPGGNQQPSAVATPSPMYTPGQPVPNVFAVPTSYPTFPWPGIYDMNSAGYPVFSMNGLQQGAPGYPKSAPMNPRPRNLNPMRGVGPRRTVSSSETQGVVGASGSSNGNGITSHQQQSYNSQQQQQQQQRKNNIAPAPAPAPLLGMAPQMVSHPPPQNHTNHHISHNSIPSSSSNQASNGRHYNNSYSQSVPHVSENYHYSARPYRGGGSDSRPRSSITRRGPPRRDDEGPYEYNNAPAPNYRSNPSTRTVPPATASPQIPAQVTVTNQNHQIDLDLEGSAFPPLIPSLMKGQSGASLPGSANASSKNGDSPYEGRLSDVVKGVKNVKIGSGSSTDKEEASSEIVVSAAEPGAVIIGPSGEVVVSAASPSKEEEGRSNDNNYSSQTKKEFREIGVGGADENNDIRSSQARNNVVSGLRQTADKSTRTDENLLNGENQPTVVVNKSSQSTQPGGGNGENGGNRKSVTSQGGGSKSPIPGKRGVPPFQSVSMGVGTEVPYPSSNSSSLSNASSTSSTPPTKAAFVNQSTPSQAGPGRGANSSVAKTLNQQPDNNRPANSSSGLVSAAVSGHQSQANSTDKDAFPTPNFVKVPTTANSSKPFSGMTDHNPKEPVRGDEERKESGQGDAKKAEDCSNDEGPVRLSYAQVAQSRKEAAPPQPQQITPPSVPPTQANSQTAAQSSLPQVSSSGSQPVAHGEERKGRGSRDNKDSRTQSSRNPRGGNGNNGDRDRDRGEQQNHGRDRFRSRGYRSRVQSDTSDTGSTTGGSSRQRGPRSPK